MYACTYVHLRICRGVYIAMGVWRLVGISRHASTKCPEMPMPLHVRPTSVESGGEVCVCTPRGTREFSWMLFVSEAPASAPTGTLDTGEFTQPSTFFPLPHIFLSFFSLLFVLSSCYLLAIVFLPFWLPSSFLTLSHGKNLSFDLSSRAAEPSIRCLDLFPPVFVRFLLPILWCLSVVFLMISFSFSLYLSGVQPNLAGEASLRCFGRRVDLTFCSMSAADRLPAEKKKKTEGLSAWRKGRGGGGEGRRKR